LWPPRTAADAERRHQAVEAAATAAGLLADDELHSLLFGDHQFAAGGAEAAASPGHQAFTGQHIHQHPAYQQGDSGAKHSHPHTHAGDRNHDHHSGQ
jgi:hypothetical protein